jgi:hypothetical protein
MAVSLINDILNAGILRESEPPRDSWSLGTVDAEPVGSVVDVLLDGDTAATAMRYGCPCTTGDRVLTVLLGRSWMVVANLDNWIPA